MKAWHLTLPLLAITSVALVHETRARDAALSEAKAAREAAAVGPILRRGAPAASRDSSSPSTARTAGAIRDEYQKAFQGEPRDATWADGAQRLAAQRLQAVLPTGSEVRAVECRTSMCRLETSHPDRSRYEAFMRSAFLGGAPALWNAPEFSAPLASLDAAHEPLLIVSYLAREGRALPAVD